MSPTASAHEVPELVVPGPHTGQAFAEPGLARVTSVCWAYVHQRSRHDWNAQVTRDLVVPLVLDGATVRGQESVERHQVDAIRPS